MDFLILSAGGLGVVSLEKKFRAIFEKNADAICFSTLDGVVIEANEKFASLFGFTAQQIVGKSLLNIVRPEDRAKTFESLNDLASGKVDHLTAERRYLRSDNSFGWKALNAYVIKDDMGNPDFVVGILHGITKQKNLEKTLREAKTEAETANMAKSAFLANMSHEIRTPLSAVLGFSELMADPRLCLAGKAKFLSAVKRNSELLLSIINDVLDLSKMEADKIEIAIQETSLEEILTDVQMILNIQAVKAGTRLDFVLEKSAPRAIRTDTVRLKQILINIVGNAIKFTPNGSVSTRVYLKPVSADEHRALCFEVSDTGTGIPPDLVGNLFKPFSQAHTKLGQKYGGTGLGLILSKRFANLLGGDLVLTKAEVEKGCTFTITINPDIGVPVGGVTCAFESEKHLSVPMERPRFEGVKILLADDLPDNQEMFSRILNLMGAEVEVVCNGKEVLEKREDKNYDLVLMEIQMPVMDGYETVKELRRRGCKGKILALTACALDIDIQKCKAWGFDDCLIKPITSDNLYRIIKKHLNSSENHC